MEKEFDDFIENKDRDKLILKLYDKKGIYKWTQQQIADKMGIDQTRVGQIIKLGATTKLNKTEGKVNNNKRLGRKKSEITEEKIKLYEKELKNKYFCLMENRCII
ncbi:MAG: hypothetical protein JRE28_15850 [Deltaproteobacteria bacterium]|nr:hypothetical protein [Deltaproteobacteria bacterium]